MSVADIVVCRRPMRGRGEIVDTITRRGGIEERAGSGRCAVRATPCWLSEDGESGWCRWMKDWGLGIGGWVGYGRVEMYVCMYVCMYVVSKHGARPLA